jgi:hypothetical protein
LAGSGLARPGAAAPYTLGAPKSEVSAWPNGAAGFVFSGGAGSVHETYQTSQAAGGTPNQATYIWKLPTSIPPEGAKGSITVNAVAGSEVWAPGFSINGVLVGCAGITNTPSYGTGCAEGDHVAVGVSLQPGHSKSVTQEFLIKPGVGTVTVSIEFFPQQFVYTSEASASSPATTSTSNGRFAQAHYSLSATFSQPKGKPQAGTRAVLGMVVHATGSFEALKGKSEQLRGNQGKGTAQVVILEPNARQVIELVEEESYYVLPSHPGSSSGIRIVYKVTSSTLACLPPGRMLQIAADGSSHGGGGGMSVYVCGLHTTDFKNPNEEVTVTAH